MIKVLTRFLLLILSVATLAVVLYSKSARADGGTTNPDDFGFFLGQMLPNQVEGVEDILPVFGGRYGFGTNFGAIELGLQNSHAMGVDFSSINVDVRGEVALAPGITGMLYLGPVLNWYSRKNTSDRVTDYGLEVGGAGRITITDALSLRADLKFMGGPGTSMFLLFGIEFR